MPDIVVVTGVPGVGASRVCQRARQELGDTFTLVNFGDVMLEEALEHGLATSRDALADLPFRDQRTLQRRAGEYVTRKASEGPLLVNTHLVVQTGDGFRPGFPPAVRSDVDASVLVVVDAPTDAIARRREESERSYPDAGPSTIAFYQQLQSAAALTYSTETDAPVQHVANDDDVAAAAAELVAIANGVTR
jgi:adenylate kinase